MVRTARRRPPKYRKIEIASALMAIAVASTAAVPRKLRLRPTLSLYNSALVARCPTPSAEIHSIILWPEFYGADAPVNISRLKCLVRAREVIKTALAAARAPARKLPRTPARSESWPFCGLRFDILYGRGVVKIVAFSITRESFVLSLL